jgi:phosphatidylglycerophosphate synthase
LILVVANYTNITPNQISITAFLLGLLAAHQFYAGTVVSLICGAILYHFSFVLDCMDGKISRLKGTSSIFGSWLDYILDRTRVAICAFSLMVGQYDQTGDILFFYLAWLICFLDSVRYLDSLLIYRAKNEMERKLGKVWIPHEKKTEPNQREIENRFPSYTRINSFFLRRRVRLHLFSGIEYQMFIFIIGPIMGLIKEMVIFSSLLLIAFELLVIYKLWLSTIDFERELRTSKLQEQEPLE